MPSFDIVSKTDLAEIDNALANMIREMSQRYDFKNIGARVELSGETITMAANSEERCKAVLDVLQTKLVKRGVSLKHLEYSNDGEPRASGKEYRLEAALTRLSAIG